MLLDVSQVDTVIPMLGGMVSRNVNLFVGSNMVAEIKGV
jgi:hypothetical protein